MAVSTTIDVFNFSSLSNNPFVAREPSLRDAPSQRKGSACVTARLFARPINMVENDPPEPLARRNSAGVSSSSSASSETAGALKSRASERCEEWDGET